VGYTRGVEFFTPRARGNIFQIRAQGTFTTKTPRPERLLDVIQLGAFLPWWLFERYWGQGMGVRDKG
jgi:hypothetical protein